MYCQICGDENSQYYPAKRQSLCKYCAEDTPKKAGKMSFDKFYWDKPGEVPKAIKRDFYEDYLRSTCTLNQYKEQTTETIV